MRRKAGEELKERVWPKFFEIMVENIKRCLFVLEPGLQLPW